MRWSGWLVGAALLADGTGRACGPFFADTVLIHPQAVLDVPPVSYLSELAEVAGIDGPITIPSGIDRLTQVPVEIAELEAHWRAEGVDEEKITKRATRYRTQRTALLNSLTRERLNDLAEEDAPAPPAPLDLGPGFPADVVDYLKGARELAAGNKDGAREIWRKICQRPAAETRMRRAWAAWMLASTTDDRDEAVKWYREVIAMVKAGAADSLGLAGGAHGWLSTLDAGDDPVEAIRLTYLAVKAGHYRSVPDLRNRCATIVAHPDPAVLARAARDPEIRSLIHLEFFARLDGPQFSPIGEAEQKPLARWLEVLDAEATGPDPDAARIAWALYATGRFDEAADWLKRSDEADPRAGWLRGKLALRAGRIDDAKRELAQSIEREKQDPEGWTPANPLLDGLWGHSGPERASSAQGRLLADLGMVELSSGEYESALESLVEGGYWEDAAYVAEQVLSADELRDHLLEVAPEWSAAAVDFWSGAEQSTEWGGTYRYGGPADPTRFEQGPRHDLMPPMTEHDQLRYLLARRLAREWRFDDAREWMPPSLIPLFDHYVALHRARRSGHHRGEDLAAITWRQALIHRIWGMEMFGTESSPDGHLHDGSFAARDFAELRGWWGGAESEAPSEFVQELGPPVLAVSQDEIRRIQAHRLPEEKRQRFHYRFTAAEIAWKAAAALPDNHPQLAGIYHTAGLWLADRDPQAADRFYQALVRRCAGTEDGRRADAKRWFPGDIARPGQWHPLPGSLEPRSLPSPPGEG
ncbi:tetratricopeptide repeat protein [Haloferula sp. A504]|uniref:tetratricopeptide repeat protein n=1 Tax=Haloferula sp. A504 TaxID=3373601 RepID=UPI0031C34C38|nr:tetratricopeptide repeat protein [Verrucomicrobiaceae bacterium E54]